jgi:hypothetical protein
MPISFGPEKMFPRVGVGNDPIAVFGRGIFADTKHSVNKIFFNI